MNEFMALSESERRERVISKFLPFLAGYTACDISRIRLDTDIVYDLGQSGDDGFEIISFLCREFGTDFSQFDFKKEIGNENSGILSLLLMPFSLFVSILKKKKIIYHKSSLTVSHLVEAAVAGEWRYNA